jgi:hypothetical protein
VGLLYGFWEDASERYHQGVRRPLSPDPGAARFCSAVCRLRSSLPMRHCGSSAAPQCPPWPAVFRRTASASGLPYRRSVLNLVK